MAYVAVSGGEEAIEASIALLNYYRSGTDKDLDLEVIEAHCPPHFRGVQGHPRRPGSRRDL